MAASETEQAVEADSPARRSSRRWRVLAFVAAAVLLIASLGLFTTSIGQALLRAFVPGFGVDVTSPAVVTDFPRDLEFDATRQPMPGITPGTVVNDGPPDDWSHMVLRNELTVVEADKPEMAETWGELLGRFSLAVLADVAPPSETVDHYTLGRIGMGWCCDIDGQTTVISTGTHAELGAGLSGLDAIILAMQEGECEKTVRIVARSAVTLIYDADQWIAYDGEHANSKMRVAIFVHPRTGQLAAFTWIVPAADRIAPGGAVMCRLPANYIMAIPLRMRSGNITGIPSPGDVAMLGLPDNLRTQPIDEPLQAAAHAQTLTPQSAEQIQAHLWNTLGWE